MFQKIVLLALLLSSSAVFADEATPATVGCGDLARLAQEYSAARRELQNAMVADMHQSSSVMLSWYSVLAAYYGEVVVIPYGRFEAMKNSSKTVETNAQYFTDRDSALTAKMDQIVLLAAKCSP